jgi:hypothetical protein
MFQRLLLITDIIRKFLRETVIAKLRLYKNSDLQTQTSSGVKGETFSININAIGARVIDTFPLNIVDISKNTLENFHISKINAKKGIIVLNINFPVIIEEYPYSDFLLKNNKAFGATESGLVNINHQISDEQNFTLKLVFKIMSQAGIGIARDYQSYDTRREIITTLSGKYDYNLSDFAVNTVSDENFAFVGRIGVHKKLNLEGPPINETEYISYIAETVGRYKEKVKFWQTLKEPSPDKRTRPGNDAGLSPRDVVRVLELSYNTIKSVDPNATVYFPGLGAPIKRGGQYTDESYLSEIISLGGGKYFDAIGFDAYVFDIEQQVQTYTTILKRYGYDKPLWVAQTGVPAGKITQPIPFKGGGSDKAQVEFMVKAYATAFALGVEKVFWGEFLDNSKSEEEGRGAYSDTWNQTGLFYTGTWAKKPGYFTHRLLATALDNFTGATQLTPNIVKFIFSNRSPIYLVWPT